MARPNDRRWRPNSCRNAQWDVGRCQRLDGLGAGLRRRRIAGGRAWRLLPEGMLGCWPRCLQTGPSHHLPGQVWPPYSADCPRQTEGGFDLRSVHRSGGWRSGLRGIVVLADNSARTAAGEQARGLAGPTCTDRARAAVCQMLKITLLYRFPVELPTATMITMTMTATRTIANAYSNSPCPVWSLRSRISDLLPA
jgi:hypothetical protein